MYDCWHADMTPDDGELLPKYVYDTESRLSLPKRKHLSRHRLDTDVKDRMRPETVCVGARHMDYTKAEDLMTEVLKNPCCRYDAMPCNADPANVEEMPRVRLGAMPDNASVYGDHSVTNRVDAKVDNSCPAGNHLPDGVRNAETLNLCSTLKDRPRNRENAMACDLPTLGEHSVRNLCNAMPEYRMTESS